MQCHFFVCHHWISVPPTYPLIYFQHSTDSSILLMTWCVVAWVCCYVRASSTVSVLHWTGLRMAAVMSDETEQAGAGWRWVCVFVSLTTALWEWGGCQWCHCLMMLMSLFFLLFFTEKEAVELSGCEWTPSSGAADQLSCRAPVCFLPSAFQGKLKQ